MKKKVKKKKVKQKKAKQKKKVKQIEAKKTFFITMSNPSQNVIDELLTSFIFLGKLVHLIEKEEPHVKQSLVEKMTKEDLEIYLAFKRQLEEINK